MVFYLSQRNAQNKKEKFNPIIVPQSLGIMADDRLLATYKTCFSAKQIKSNKNYKYNPLKVDL